MRSLPRSLPRLLAATALLASLGAQAQIVTNGSFEAAGPNLVAGSYCYLGYAPLECGSLPGWTGALPVMTSSSSPWGNPSGLAGWDASFGSMQVGLQNTSSMEQSLGLAPGSYTLTWSDAGRGGYGNTAYDVSYGTQLLGNFTTASGQGWASHSLSFTATGADVLKFQGLSVSTDGTAFIDKVAVSAVPEPTTALLLAGGLAVVSLARRRRQG